MENIYGLAVALLIIWGILKINKPVNTAVDMASDGLEDFADEATDRMDEWRVERAVARSKRLEKLGKKVRKVGPHDSVKTMNKTLKSLTSKIDADTATNNK